MTAKCKGSGQFGGDVDEDTYISSILLTKLIYRGKNILTIFFLKFKILVNLFFMCSVWSRSAYRREQNSHRGNNYTKRGAKAHKWSVHRTNMVMQIPDSIHVDHHLLGGGGGCKSESYMESDYEKL